ncbi:cytochrome c oxidase assembly protein [Cellulomonas triticagri]|uniref:cytochrome c oxidase assembly protein n=1 Tax=Cellulomonas triticagri TaxID=2483352 RepID=UPI001F33A1AA|nr:cytochrome c oxidase assembly protein [Cellulomonas triticagri]
MSRAPAPAAAADEAPAPFTFPRVTRTEAVLLVALPLAVAACLTGLASTGELAPSVLLDPGDVVRYGLPVARVVHDLSAALTIGLLVLAAGVLPGQDAVRGVVSYAQWTAVRWGARAAAVWFTAAAAVIVLTAANSMGTPLSAPGTARQVLYYATAIDLGQYLSVSLLLVAATLVVALLARRVTWVGVACALAVAALLPVALSGHAAGADDHRNAVNSLAVHLVAVCVWLGGLVALVLLRPRLRGCLGPVVRRYSVLAAWCLAGAGFSGVVNALLRVSRPEDLISTGYGVLLLLKIAAITALGIAGLAQRRAAIPRLDGPGGGRAFTRLALAEVVLMAVTFGLSVALSRSAPPVPQTPVTWDPRHALLGFPYPPEVSVRTYLTGFEPDWLFLAGSVVLAGLYLAGVRRLRRRGDAWPPGRTAAWLLGCVLLAWVTSGGPNVYGSVHFSTHMILHMGLMMYVPLPLALGAPVLLALRALPARDDASRGPREWLLLVVHSRYLAVLSRPAVAGTVFAGSLVAFYYTGWFEYALFEHPGHLLMQVHFLLSGYLFFWVLVGVDPGPDRASYPIRLVTLLATMAFHAFFGVAVMGSTEVLGAGWWAALGGADTAALLADQAIGGSIAWGAGELPVVIAALVVAVQWARDDERRARRTDRQADRDGDAELHRYNAYLQDLADRDPSGTRPAPNRRT